MSGHCLSLEEFKLWKDLGQFLVTGIGCFDTNGTYLGRNIPGLTVSDIRAILQANPDSISLIKAVCSIFALSHCILSGIAWNEVSKRILESTPQVLLKELIAEGRLLELVPSEFLTQDIPMVVLRDDGDEVVRIPSDDVAPTSSLIGATTVTAIASVAIAALMSNKKKDKKKIEEYHTV